MVQQHVFSHSDLPEEYRCQILCFLRIVWPEGFVGKNRLRDWITPKESHPIHFILEEKGILISHLEVVWKNINFNKISFKAYGLTGIFTYPAFRNQGHSKYLIEAAKKYITSKHDADFIIFHSSLENFYEKLGFLPMKTMTTLKGREENPDTSDETAYMLFISDLAKKNKKDLDNGVLFFGEDTW